MSSARHKRASVLVRILPILAAGIGLAATAALVAYFGAGAVFRSLVAVGVGGFVAVCLLHLVLTAVMGVAWRALLPGVPVLRMIWGRLMRDAGAEALPLSQFGGYVLGARVLSLAHVPGSLATATTIVDVTLEFIAQLVYTALGAALLLQLDPDTEVGVPVIIGLGVAVLAAAIFVFAQRRGFAVFERIGRAIGQGWAERGAAGAAALHAAMEETYRDQGRLAVNCFLHFVCWVASAGEVWLALWFAGEPLPFAAALAIESLLNAIRTAAFAVPQAVGVQEGAYILLGASFGLSPEMALALSLLKRGRDLVLGLPAIAVWQAIEGSRLFRRRPGRRPARVGGALPPSE